MKTEEFCFLQFFVDKRYPKVEFTYCFSMAFLNLFPLIFCCLRLLRRTWIPVCVCYLTKTIVLGIFGIKIPLFEYIAWDKTVCEQDP